MRFVERFNVPPNETVIAEFDCQMRVESIVKKRGQYFARKSEISTNPNNNRTAGRRSSVDVTDLQLPNGAVACHISVSASYVGVYSKKAKFTKAIYLHGEW